MTLMTNLGQAVVVSDFSGGIVQVNAIALQVLGYDAASLVGRNWSLLGLPNPPVYSLLGDLQLVRRGGAAFMAEVAVSPYQTYAFATIRDISKHKLAEEALREVENRFRDLAGSALDWFWETDSDHQLIFISQRVATLLGVNVVEAIGMTFGALGLRCVPESADQHLADLAAHRPFRDRVFQVTASDGTGLRTLRISGTPTFDDRQTFVGYRGVGVDITREIQAEAQARQVRQILEDSIASLGDGVVVFDRNGKLVTCNRAYLNVLGKQDVSQMVGLTLDQIMRQNRARFDLQGRDFEEWLGDRLNLHRQATGQPFILRLDDGSWVLSRECRMGDGGVVGVRTDITEIKHRESEMEALKTRYQLILDSAGEGIIGLDGEGRVSFANQTAHSLLRYLPGALNGKLFQQDILLADDDHQSIDSVYAQGVAQHVTDQVFRRTDGQSMPVDYFAAPLMQDDSITGAVVVFQDATLRIRYEHAMASVQQDLERLVNERTQELSREVAIRSRTEAALRESRARMKGVTDSLLEGVLVVNGGGDIMLANPMAHTLLCPDCSDELEGLPMDQFVLLGSAQAAVPFADSPWRAVIRGQGEAVRSDDATFTTADGRELSVAYACTQLAVEGGTVAAVILFRDIRELKDAQWDALQASRLASVGQLAAGIAHEINTPTQYIGDNLRFLNDSFQAFQRVLQQVSDTLPQLLDSAVSAQVQTLRDAFDAEDIPYLIEELPQAISQSQEGVEQVRRIVLSMKEFSHPGSSDKVMSDINRALESTLTVCRNTWKHVAEVDMRFDPKLPQILCFPSELNQVFLNLIINATHAIESANKGGMGRITITTRADDDWLEVLVQDTGTGVPAAIRDRIFDPFFTTKPVGKGTGQGLAICRDVVVSKHGGRLDVESVDNVGATFIVRLPVLVPEDCSSRDTTI